MSAEPYSDRVRELFSAPAHAGRIHDGPSAYVEEQGVRVRLSAALDGSRIARMRFEAWGCPHLIAAAEACCAALEGERLAALDAFSAGELMQTLAVPREKTGRILVLEDAVRSLGISAMPDATSAH